VQVRQNAKFEQAPARANVEQGGTKTTSGESKSNSCLNAFRPKRHVPPRRKTSIVQEPVGSSIRKELICARHGYGSAILVISARLTTLPAGGLSSVTSFNARPDWNLLGCPQQRESVSRE
jgi:hypothetical protein